tara:strand:- start:294 stop:473 length:180 start_codon:yes stop_codon:yes gene_type:complete
LGIQISKSWNKDPNWFNCLPRKDKEMLLAVYRVENETSEDLKKRRHRYQRGRLNESNKI